MKENNGKLVVKGVLKADTKNQNGKYPREILMW